MRVALYPRVSSREQAKEGYSIGEQTERLTKFCDAKGWMVHRVYTDGGYSGKDLNRPALQELIRDARSGAFDMVLVYKLDRISRNQRDILTLIEDVFMANGVEFASMTENFDTSTPFGRAILGILAVFAQLEREQIKERITMGLEARAKDGYWTGGGNAPIGYDFGPGSVLEVNEYESLQVQEAFDMFLKRYPISRIVDELNNRGYVHKYGSWKIMSLKDVLKRPVYCGLVSYKGEISEGKHEAIIDMETFEKAQELFKERDRNNPEYKNSFKYKSPLGGLLHCKQCTAYYSRKKSHILADGTPVYKYCCNSYLKPTESQIKNPDCSNKKWFAEQLENIIFGEVHKLAFDPAYIEQQIQGDTKRSDNDKSVVAMSKRVDEIDKTMSRLMDLYALGSLEMEDIKAKIEPLSKEKEKLNHHIEVLKESDSRMSPSEAQNIARSFGEVLETGSLDDMRFVLNELINRIELNGEKVVIHWNFV